MKLIDTLKTQHALVLQLVNRINGHLSQAEVDQVNQALTELKTGLVAHLQLEDQELYTGLSTVAKEKNDESMASTARMFSSNMGRITEALLAFLDKYEGKRFDVAAFTRDWNSIVAVLSARIQSEERNLYPLYERFVEGSARRK